MTLWEARGLVGSQPHPCVRLTCLSAPWSSGGLERTTPLPFCVCNGHIVLEEPLHFQLPVNQCDFHHDSPRRPLIGPPIPTRLCGWGCGLWQGGAGQGGWGVCRAT